MSIEAIVDGIIKRLREDADTPGMLGPVTASGNPSVAYLPGGFATMKNMLNSLSTIKKKWKIEVLEKSGYYNLSFEDAFRVSIPKRAYEEFNSKVVNVIGKKEIDLTEMINEARTEIIHNLYDKLTRALTVDLRENSQVKRTLVLMNYWLSVFKDSKFLPMRGQTAIQLNTYDSDVRVIIDRMQNIYTDDIGNLQILIDTIKDDRPLNGYTPFSEYDYLVSCRIQTNYNGIVMILEMSVNMAMVATQSIYIESEKVLEELEAYRTVKVLKDIVLPITQMFRPSIFNNIKDIIDYSEEE